MASSLHTSLRAALARRRLFTPIAADSEAQPASFRELLRQGLSYPPQSLARQQALTQIIHKMQASGQIWAGQDADPDRYAEALASTWMDFCRGPESFLAEAAADIGLIERFNRTLRQRL